MIPDSVLCPADCICWKCKLHEIYNYCCNDTRTNLDCPEDKLGQHCPDFEPIQVQSTGLNK